MAINFNPDVEGIVDPEIGSNEKLWADMRRNKEDISNNTNKLVPVYENVQLNFTNGSYYNYTTGVVTVADANYNYADPVNVLSGEVYNISGLCKFAANIVLMVDANDNIVEVFPNQNVKTQFNNYQFEIKNNVTKLLINKSDAVNTVLQKNIGFNTEIKKIAIIGDSISAENYTSAKKYHYWLNEIDKIEIENLAVSGSGYYSQYSINLSFYHQALTLGALNNGVLLFGSFNDMTALKAGTITIGTILDSGTTTICGLFNLTIDAILNINKNIKIGVVTPTPWQYYNTLLQVGDANYLAIQYVQALIDLCNHRGIKLLNLFRESNLRPETENIRTSRYYKNDGVHPNDIAHLENLYPSIKSFASELV